MMSGIYPPSDQVRFWILKPEPKPNTGMGAGGSGAWGKMF